MAEQKSSVDCPHSNDQDAEHHSPSQDVPDVFLSPDAVLNDVWAEWRQQKTPVYQSTRQLYEKEKTVTHEPASLSSCVQNLVKNWEIEASHKSCIRDWRTIDPDRFTFSMNGGLARSAEDMLHAGTYNAILDVGNEWYDHSRSDFEASHAAFRGALEHFAWEVVEVVGQPPLVSVKWRHWGHMSGDYRAINRYEAQFSISSADLSSEGKEVHLPANNRVIEIFGVTIAHTDDLQRFTKLETFMDPAAMFRQMATRTEEEVVVSDPSLSTTGPDMTHEMADTKS